MLNINITNFRNNIYSILEQTIKFNEQVNITTKEGNAIVMSEADYKSLMEMVYIYSIPNLKSKIIDGLNTPISECISEDEVKW